MATPGFEIEGIGIGGGGCGKEDVLLSLHIILFLNLCGTIVGFDFICMVYFPL